MVIDTDTDNVGAVIFAQANDGHPLGSFEIVPSAETGPEEPPENAPKLVRLTFER